jgi:KipI family sensor histidine kinase inhibitor
MNMAPTDRETAWPRLAPLGTDGLLVSFGDRLDDAANRAALSFRAAADGAGIGGLAETATSLASVYLRFEGAPADIEMATEKVRQLMHHRDWLRAELPQGRRLWRIPCVFGTDLAPQLDEAATAAGLSAEAAVRSITSTRLRVQTIGFAPGQPYLGELPPEWDIPRQSRLTDRIPIGALCVAIRQMVLFTVSTPTGWRHVGQTAFSGFRPEAATPFVLAAGDEVEFHAVSADDLSRMAAAGPDGGSTAEPLPCAAL